jgi:hypothetical protein
MTAMFIIDGFSFTYPWLNGTVKTSVATCPTGLAASKRQCAGTTLLGLTSLGPKNLQGVFCRWTQWSSSLKYSERNFRIVPRLEGMCSYTGVAESFIKKSKAIPVTGRGGLQGCEILRIPHCLDNRLAFNCEILATCSSTYSPVCTSQEAHCVSIKQSYPRNRPWRPIGLWDVKVPTLFGSQLTARYWLLVAVFTVQFIPHRKHIPSS